MMHPTMFSLIHPQMILTATIINTSPKTILAASLAVPEKNRRTAMPRYYVVTCSRQDVESINREGGSVEAKSRPHCDANYQVERLRVMWMN